MKDRAKGPEALTDVLGRLFLAKGWGRLSEKAKLEAAWRTVAGEAIANDTRVTSHRRGVLEIEVKSGVLMQELVQFQKRSLLKGLREGLPHLTFTDLKFRSGTW